MISEAMGMLPNAVQIGYTFSTEKTNQLPRYLHDVSSFKTMMAEAEGLYKEELLKKKAKKAKNNTVKFWVKITDLQERSNTGKVCNFNHLLDIALKTYSRQQMARKKRQNFLPSIRRKSNK